MQQAAASKTVNFAALFSCALKKRLGDANFSRGEMILTGQFLAVGSPGE